MGHEHRTRPGEFWHKYTAMLTIMLFAAAIAILPAVLNTGTHPPAAHSSTDEDVLAAMERAC